MSKMISVPKPARQQSIPKPSVQAFSASRAVKMSGQAPARASFKPLAKDPTPKSHWSGK